MPARLQVQHVYMLLARSIDIIDGPQKKGSLRAVAVTCMQSPIYIHASATLQLFLVCQRMRIWSICTQRVLVLDISAHSYDYRHSGNIVCIVLGSFL